MSDDYNRLNLLFEMENIKSPLMNYIAPGVNLKIVADLGSKDSNGNKKRFYEETRYKSDKYKNTNYLISANFRVNTYLVLEYPNPDLQNQIQRSKSLIIRAFAIDDLVEKMREVNKLLVSSFTMKDNRLYIKSSNMFEVFVYPSVYSSISFSPDIYESQDRQEMGIRITINNEYSVIISAETVWPEMVYRLSHCDLTMLGFQMIQSYMALLPGMAVSEFGGEYNASSRYAPYYEDPDDIINSPESVKITKTKYLTNDEKKRSFFSDL